MASKQLLAFSVLVQPMVFQQVLQKFVSSVQPIPS
jgi:hypothetical protein